MSNTKDYERFFENAESIVTESNYSSDSHYLDVEDLYRAFKARMIDELKLNKLDNSGGMD